MNTNNKIKITIVTVVYNSVGTINETMLSVLNQLYDNIEYIVIDGGSSDGTVEIIKQHTDKINYWCSERDNGIYDAMNKALGHATGDYVIFINSGDMLFSPYTLSEAANKMIDKESVYYGNALYINGLTNDPIWRGGPFNKYRLAKTNICHQTIFYPKIIYSKYHYNPKYSLFADWVYNMQIYPFVNFAHIGQTISYYDCMGVSALKNDDIFKREQISLIRKNLGLNCIAYLVCNKLQNILSKYFGKLS